MRYAPLLVLLVAVAALAGAQAAYPNHGHGHSHGNGHGGSVVWAQTNEISGNHIVVYDRASDGTLSQAGTYATGGNGGAAAPGTESDHLATQGSLVYDPGHSVLIAVNAGSDTVTTFKVHGDRLQGRKTVSSGGEFPAGIAVHGRLVYVLNAGGSGTVQGYWLRGHHLRPIAGSARSLGLANTNPPNFLSSPGQVGFSPNGRKLLVTTKLSGSAIDVFRVRHDGTLSATPVANPLRRRFRSHSRSRTAGSPERRGRRDSLTSYGWTRRNASSDPKSADRRPGGAVLDPVRAGKFFYVSNTGSNTLSSFTLGADGSRPCSRGRRDDQHRQHRSDRFRPVSLRTDRPRGHDRRLPHQRRRLVDLDWQRHRPADRPGGHRVQLKHLARREGLARRGPPGAGRLQVVWRGSRSTTSSTACVCSPTACASAAATAAPTGSPTSSTSCASPRRRAAWRSSRPSSTRSSGSTP